MDLNHDIDKKSNRSHISYWCGFLLSLVCPHFALSLSLTLYLPLAQSWEIEHCFQLSFDAVMMFSNFISLEAHIIRLMLLLFECGIALMKFNIKVDLNEYVLYVLILNHTTSPWEQCEIQQTYQKPVYEKKMCLYESTMHENLESSESQNSRVVRSLLLSDSFSFVLGIIWSWSWSVLFMYLL